MAKIISVTLDSIPDEIIVSDSLSDITVITKIEFHPLDVQLGMEYSLHLFVYDINGKIDIPIIVNNWDQTGVLGVSIDHKDDFLGTTQKFIKAEERVLEITCDLSLRLGKLGISTSYYGRDLNVFATIVPAIARASKWGVPFTSNIVF